MKWQPKKRLSLWCTTSKASRWHAGESKSCVRLIMCIISLDLLAQWVTWIDCVCVCDARLARTAYGFFRCHEMSAIKPWRTSTTSKFQSGNEYFSMFHFYQSFFVVLFWSIHSAPPLGSSITPFPNGIDNNGNKNIAFSMSMSTTTIKTDETESDREREREWKLAKGRGTGNTIKMPNVPAMCFICVWQSHEPPLA